MVGGAQGFEEMVLEHVEAENAQDPERVRLTYSEDPTFIDVAEGVEIRGFSEILESYQERWRGFPDSHRIVTRIQADDALAYTEIEITGTHAGHYKGLPPTGKHHSLKICACFEAAPDGRIQTERVYYDRVAAMVALEVLPELDSALGRLWLAIHRPSILWKRLRGRIGPR